jgi:hypothetical protein
MAKKMKLIFEKGGELQANFLEQEAPVTTQLFWEQLPLEVNIAHCMSACHEIYTDDISVNGPIPEENLIHRGAIGDGATVSGNQSAYLTQLEKDHMTTLCFVYGPEQRFQGTTVQSNRATIFCKIKEDLHLLREIGHRIRIHGKEKLTMIGYEE